MTTYDPSPTYSSGGALRDPQVTGWTGWTVFAAVMMGLAGAFGIIAGLVALFRDEVYLVTTNKLIINVDYSAWGWIHLAVGGLLVLAAVSLAKGHMYGRVVAIIAACMSALANIAFLPAYPVWSTLIIAVDLLVIFAVTVHGRELHE